MPVRSQTATIVSLSCLLAVVGCGSQHPNARSSERDGGASSPRSTVPVEACGAPVTDPALVQDRNLPGALHAGPLVIYPADDIARIPPATNGDAASAKVVVITTGATPVTLTVGRDARPSFSLLFAGATTGSTPSGFRVVDGIAAVRFPACGRGPLGFRGGFLYRGAQCAAISVRADGEPTVHATIAVGRPPASCPGTAPPGQIAGTPGVGGPALRPLNAARLGLERMALLQPGTRTGGRVPTRNR